MVRLSEGQKLSDVLDAIPSNCILSKRIPGCGATTLEIQTKRDSIIIVPNVPVINSKCDKFPDDLLGVHERVKVGKIVDWLKTHKTCKIMTTPESFRKVKTACRKCGIDIYSKFFLLNDECHQLIKDEDYREDIIMPMDDFFRFRNKALVSATPLQFSDPRFKEHGFKIIEVNADYGYRQEITVIHTYRLVKAMKEYLDLHKEGKLCIFFNSVEGIYSLMEKFRMLEDSAVYCAQQSCYKLRNDYDFKNCFHEWSADTMKRYNFFTARFFCGFDLELLYKPDLLMISDPHVSPYTMLDVDTDCIQICGRFRKGLNSATHIFCTDQEIVAKSEERMAREISCHEHAYNEIRTLYENAPNKEYRYAFGDALETLPFRKYLYPDFTKNWFAIDNAINEEQVKGKYKYRWMIENWYSDCHYFIPTFNRCEYNRNDEKLEMIRKSRSTKERRRRIVRILNEFKQPYSEEAHDFINKIRKEDPDIVEAYEVLGSKEIEEADYSPKKMREKIIWKKRKGNVAIKLIKNSFRCGCKYTYKFIEEEFKRIYGLLGIHPEKPINRRIIEDYFEAVECRSAKARGYILVSELI